MTLIGNVILVALVIALFALIFTKLGEVFGLHANWLRGAEIPGSESSGELEANASAVLAATRNMISILGPIFIGLAVWMVTVVAEKRLKAYDEALEKQRAYIEDRSDKNREFLDKRIQELRKETKDEIKEGLDRVKAAIEAGIAETVTNATTASKVDFRDTISEKEDELIGIKRRVEDVEASLNIRFGHIANYSKVEEEFGEISSVGAVHYKVSQLFKINKRAEAILLTRELLRRFEEGAEVNRPAGALNDWFNLSATLGRNDEEAIALQVCLAGLAQQNGASVFVGGKANWQVASIQPNDDLLAHAIQYARTIGSTMAGELIALNGYDPATQTGRKTWGWRSYNFTMEALAELGRQDEAIALGGNFLRSVPLTADTSKVLQTLGSIMYGFGLRVEAITLLKGWLKENPSAPAAQVCTTLLDWLDGIAPIGEMIDIASRGIRDLAEEQASSSLSNLFYRRALVRDKEALRLADAGRAAAPRICEFVRLALADYEMAGKLDLNPGIHGQLMSRVQTLRDLAKRVGCDDGPGGDFDADDGEDEGETDSSSPEAKVRALMGRIVPLVSADGVSDAQKASAITRLLQAEDEIVQMLAMGLLRKVAEDERAPDQLRRAIAAVLPLLPFQMGADAG